LDDVCRPAETLPAGTAEQCPPEFLAEHTLDRWGEAVGFWVLKKHTETSSEEKR
jgi:hypothetical protein